MPTDDRTLDLTRLLSRDPGAIEAAVTLHARRVYRTARGMGFSADDAEDLTQDVFVTFLQTLDRFEARSTVGTWLVGILHRKAQERWRMNVRDDAADPIDETFEARFNTDGSWQQPPIPADRQVEAGQTARALRKCLARLSAQQREVFQLREVDGLPAGDVGRILGCSTNHVGVLFHRARTRLRACLEIKGWGMSR